MKVTTKCGRTVDVDVLDASAKRPLVTVTVVEAGADPDDDRVMHLMLEPGHAEALETAIRAARLEVEALSKEPA